MTRTMAHSLHAISQKNNWDFEFWSAYDSNDDLISKYLPAANFKGFAEKARHHYHQPYKPGNNWPTG